MSEQAFDSARKKVQGSASPSSSTLQRKCDNCRKNHLLQRSVIRQPPKPAPSQSGHDFSRVRVHPDDRPAVEGREIAFGGGMHPADRAVQHRPWDWPRLGVDADTWERHANAVADRVVQGRSAADLLTAGIGRPRLQLQKDPGAGRGRSVPRGPDLNELARWPDDALSAWPTLDDGQRTKVIQIMAEHYGARFAQEFKDEAGMKKHKEPTNYYYGPGITWITPKKLLDRGFRLAQKDSVHEWWVHPRGASVTRHWDKSEPTTGTGQEEGVPQPEETGPRPQPNCKDVQTLGDAICDNATRICRIADELGDDASAKASCEKARRTCDESRKRSNTCGPQPTS